METYASSRWPGVDALLTTDVTPGRRNCENESNTLSLYHANKKTRNMFWYTFNSQ